MLICQQLGNPLMTSFLVSQYLYHLLHGIVSNFKLHCGFLNCQPSVFCDEHVNFLLIAFCSDGSRSTVARKIGLVPDTIFEVSLTSHTVDTDERIPIDMKKKSVKDVCSRVTLIYKEFSHSTLVKCFSFCITVLVWILPDIKINIG
jgi:hypothetical protein